MTLKQAIERSRAYNERPTVEFAGSKSDLLAALYGLYGGEIDDAIENDGTLDVWGWTGDMAGSEMDWRLRVKLNEY